ncbi:hypothetical protein S83_016226, partial [Arachis hypogaea]
GTKWKLNCRDLSFNKGLKGPLSPEIGDLSNLNILILAGCSFNGSIPDALGNLSQLSFFIMVWLNTQGLKQLHWKNTTFIGAYSSFNLHHPGLDQLLKANHLYHSPKLLSSDMVLIHVLFDGNDLSDSIPETLELVQTLKNLAHNNLKGSLLDLSHMDTLNYV